jgi:hypothetical protein
MPYFADLTPYTFLTAPNQVSQNLLNVGWLCRRSVVVADL